MSNLQHIAIIMDGNGRWAEDLKAPRALGHKQGAQAVQNIINYSISIKLSYLTFFAFSCENWSRPKEEIDNILQLIKVFIAENLDNLYKDNVKIKVFGRKDNLAHNVMSLLIKAEEKTKNNTGLSLNIAFNYSSRDEIVRATKKLAKAYSEKKLAIEDITEEKFAGYLDTANCCDPDLVIRTSGEIRLSNFLLWQIAYSELYFCDCYWPDFTVKHFQDAIDSYKKRNRRYGAIIAK